MSTGVISLQTLSWLPEFEQPLRQIFEKIAPDWIAMSSLFYEGDISCKIEVEEHAAGNHFFYNVYSIPAVSRFAREFGVSRCRGAAFRGSISTCRRRKTRARWRLIRCERQNPACRSEFNSAARC